MLWLAAVGSVFASDFVTPSVIVHAGRQTSVFDAATVRVATERGVHRVTTPLGSVDLPVPTPGALAVPGQIWLLADRVWVEVVAADAGMVEFAIIDLS